MFVQATSKRQLKRENERRPHPSVIRPPLLLARADGSGVRDLGVAFGAAWSPDSERLAYAAVGPSCSVVAVYNLATAIQTELTSGETCDDSPTWSPDGEWLAFLLGPARGPSQVVVMRSDGSSRHQVTHDNLPKSGISWSPAPPK